MLDELDELAMQILFADPPQRDATFTLTAQPAQALERAVPLAALDPRLPPRLNEYGHKIK